MGLVEEFFDSVSAEQAERNAMVLLAEWGRVMTRPGTDALQALDEFSKERGARIEEATLAIVRALWIIQL